MNCTRQQLLGVEIKTVQSTNEQVHATIDPAVQNLASCLQLQSSSILTILCASAAEEQDNHETSQVHLQYGATLGQSKLANWRVATVLWIRQPLGVKI